MLQVNLLPWRRVQGQKRLRFWLNVTVLFPGLLLAGSWICAAFLAQHQTLLLQHVAALKLASQALSLQQRRVDAASAKVKEQMAQRLISQQKAQRSRDYLQLLTLLAENMPEELRLSELTEHQNHLTLKGEGRFYHDILAFRETLAASELLGGVSLADVRQQSGLALSFTLKMQLRQPPDVLSADKQEARP